MLKVTDQYFRMKLCAPSRNTIIVNGDKNCDFGKELQNLIQEAGNKVTMIDARNLHSLKQFEDVVEAQERSGILIINHFTEVPESEDQEDIRRDLRYWLKESNMSWGWSGIYAIVAAADRKDRIIPWVACNAMAYGECGDKSILRIDEYFVLIKDEKPLGKATDVQTSEKTSKMTEGVHKTIKDGHEYVDLGLPSGTLWATCNIGATVPEDFGSYFAWGETTEKDSYNRSNYKYAKTDDFLLTKYCGESNRGYEGFVDNLTTLESEDDAATANWGINWRMPTEDECNELKQYCVCNWTTRNGVKGLEVKASNGNSIFLPAAGRIIDSNNSNNGDYEGGCYSSSTHEDDCPWYSIWLGFDTYGCFLGNNNRFIGKTIRPVVARN